MHTHSPFFTVTFCSKRAILIRYCDSLEYLYKIKNWDVTWCASCDTMFRLFHDDTFLLIRLLYSTLILLNFRSVHGTVKSE